MTDDSLDDLIPDFIEEAEDHLKTIEADLLTIESSGDDMDLALVNRVFRGIHSIKGGAGFLGLSAIGELSHALESVLDGIRQEEISPLSEVIDACLSAADALREMLVDVGNSNDQDVSEFVVTLAQVLEPVGLEQGDELANGIEGGSDAPIVDPLVESALKREECPKEKSDGAATPQAQATGACVQASPPPENKPKSPRKDPPSSSATSVRVEVATLDRLMNLAGELVLGRNRLVRIAQSEDSLGFRDAAYNISQVTSDLQESIMSTRMQPIGCVFSKFPRVVRDLCKKLEKKAELTLSGEEVDLDRNLIEAISDPLTHLIRNAVDHGIEMPTARKAARKNSTGRIELSAFHQGGMVNIVVRDDGKGIDPEMLRKSAVKKGVISEQEASTLNDREAVNLIFRAGFSTAEEVTNVSGRGVGMDVVRTNLEALSSSVEIESVVGQGSTITVRVPLTLAIMAAVIVSSGDRSYAISQANVQELVSVRDEGQIVMAAGSPVLKFRGRLLPLLSLEQVVGSAAGKPPRPKAPLTVVVVDSGTTTFGICIERHPDAEEIVVKPLGAHLSKVPEFGGATILGDGTVALILDVAGIAARFELRRPEVSGGEDLLHAGEGHATISAEHDNVVVFAGGGEELFALPLEVLSRIERVPASEIHEVAGRRFWGRKEGTISLTKPHEVFQAAELPESERYVALVSKANGKEFGLLSPWLHDIVVVNLELDLDLKEPGVFGSFLHHGRIVRLLDIEEFTGSDDGESVKEEGESGGTREITILYAEDSRFFRETTVGFLESEKFKVVACEDGMMAWETLNSEEHQFDIILTDVEMPNMDGLGLARAVKGSERWKDIPVVALSSLGSAADVECGKQAGFDEYQVKLNKKSLIQGIRKWTGVKA